MINRGFGISTGDVVRHVLFNYYELKYFTKYKEPVNKQVLDNKEPEVKLTNVQKCEIMGGIWHPLGYDLFGTKQPPGCELIEWHRDNQAHGPGKRNIHYSSQKILDQTFAAYRKSGDKHPWEEE